MNIAFLQDKIFLAFVFCFLIRCMDSYSLYRPEISNSMLSKDNIQVPVYTGMAAEG